MAPLFGYSPPQAILRSRTSTSLLSQTIFNVYRRTSPWLEIDTLRLRRNKQRTLIENSYRSQITKSGTRFIWKQKTYAYGSSKKAEALSSTIVTLDHLNFPV